MGFTQAASLLKIGSNFALEIMYVPENLWGTFK
jgi:hypothetical protein